MLSEFLKPLIEIIANVDNNYFGNVINKFLPYTSVVDPNESPLSFCWAIFTIVFAFVFACIFWWKLRKIIKELKNATNKIQGLIKTSSDKDTKNLDSLLNTQLLSSAWKRYRETFLAIDGNAVKTVVDASVFFNFEDLLSHKINIRYWQSIPSILVGFGILGTFVGLVVGVSNFHSNTSEEIQKSIQILLGGMSTAFITSIWGMLLSLLFGVLEKWEFNHLEPLIKEIAAQFNQKFYLSNVSEFGIYRDDEGNPVYPSYVLRDLRNNSEEQTRALKQFSTDLADGIKISTQTIEEMGSSIGQSVEKSIIESLEPILAKISTAVDALNEEKKKDTGEYIGGITGQLQSSMQNMIEKMSDTTSSRMEAVAESLSQTSAAFYSISEKVEELVGLLEESTNRSKEDLESTAAIILQNSEKTSMNLSNLLDKIHDLYDKFTAIQNESTSKNTEFLEQSEQFLQRLSSSTESFNKASLNATRSLQNIGTTAVNLSESASKHDDIQNKIEKSLVLAQTVSNDYANKFTIIHEGLSGIFDKISKGLIDYQNGVTKNLNDSLGEFAEHLRTAVNTLSAVVEELYAIGENQLKSSRK